MKFRSANWSRVWAPLACASCLGLGVSAAALSDGNPYNVITNRNAFGIRPPPDPEPPPPVAPPPSAPPNIFLTGVSHSGGQKKAYFAITRPGSKQQEYETVREGEELQDLKVLEIDAKGGRVRAMVSGKEVSLNFADNGMKASPAAGVPGAPSRAGQPVPTPVAPVPAPAVTAGGPVIIGRGGVNLNQGNGNMASALPASAPTYSPGNVGSDGGAGSALSNNRRLPTRVGTSLPIPVQDTAQPVDAGGRVPLPLPPMRQE